MRRNLKLFQHARRTVCPACLDRNALNILGRPLWVKGMKKTAGCELCGGTGEGTEVDVVGSWPVGDKYTVVPEKRAK